MNNNRIMVFLNITHSCNLSCGYCYYTGEMQKKPGQMSLQLLETIFKKVSESVFDNFEFVFHGGEPTIMGADFLKHIIKLQQQYINKKSIGNSLQTNGTLVSSELIELVKKYGISVGISIDGPEEVHNYYRKYKNGSSTYSTISKNIMKLSNYGVNIGLLSVCSDITLGKISEMYPLIKSFNNIFMWDLIPPDRLQQGYILSEGNLSNIIIHLFNDWFYDTECSFDFRFLSSIVSVMLIPYVKAPCAVNKGCINNPRMMFIDIHGDVFPCDANTDIRMGNILDHPFDHFIVNHPIRRKYSLMEEKRLERCMFCEWYKYCNGGCPFNYSEQDGSVNYYCNDYKKIFRYIKNTLVDKGLIGSNGIDINSFDAIPNPKLRKKVNGYIGQLVD